MNTTIIVGRRIRKFLKKPFPKRLCMLLLILCFSSLSIIVHAQSELIGKNIIIPPLNNYYQYSFDSFYHGTDFHKEKLEKKYRYKANAEGFTPPEEILGHEFEIIDVFNIDSRKPEKKSINIVMVEKDFKDTILFRIPLAIITIPYPSAYLTIKSFSSLYCTYSKAGPFMRSGLVFDFVPRFNFTHYYETDYIEQIEDTFTSSFGGWLQHDYGNGKKCICKSIELFLNTDKKNPSYCYS